MPKTERRSDVVERFMRYVVVATQSDPTNEDEVPSSAGEHDLAALLAEELRALGCDDACADEHAYVTASMPASPNATDAPPLGLIAHLDTAPSAPGDHVHPHVVHYEGGELISGVVGDTVVATSPEQEPDLKGMVGSDIICSDGTTLLGADDKAGVAEIMALVTRLRAHPELPHPALRIAFVPDEEIGHGASLLDLERFGARYAYTVDGGPLGEFSYECFNAALATVTFAGVPAHTGDAKGRMLNALTLAAHYDSLLPADERPERTEGREGFFHLEALSGTSATATASYLVRDFEAHDFAARLDLMRSVADDLNERHGAGTVHVAFREQYRNMAERLTDLPFLVDFALEANREAGVEPFILAVRGGTDGAQLTFRGLPCPNIATGGYNFHSTREFIPLRSLEITVDILEHLVAKFASADLEGAAR